MNEDSFAIPNDLASACTLAAPPRPNWRFYFGDAPDVYFQFYFKEPPNRFQRWMIKKVLGIRWEKIGDTK